MFSIWKDGFTPTKLDWFEKKGYKVLDFSAAEIYAILKVQDKQGGLSIMGLIHPDYYYNAEEYFG